MPPTSPLVVDATRDNFQAVIIDRSFEVPVVVDFWAAWCQPCRMLGPVLEKLAAEYAGRFVLVKADTEALPEVASGFGVRSIPAVFALRDGQIVDSFVGALPESSIRDWLDRLMPSPAELLAREARETEESDPAAAEAKYREALGIEPKRPDATIGLGRTLLAQGRTDEARELVRALEARGFLEPEAERLKAQLDVRLRAGDAGDLGALRAALAADPKNLALRLKLAEALAAEGQHAEALEHYLSLVEDDRKGTGEDARKAMLSLFQVVPDTELVDEYRRRLAAALF